MQAAEDGYAGEQMNLKRGSVCRGGVNPQILSRLSVSAPNPGNQRFPQGTSFPNLLTDNALRRDSSVAITACGKRFNAVAFGDSFGIGF
jgi:hypothetical protein